MKALHARAHPAGAGGAVGLALQVHVVHKHAADIGPRAPLCPTCLRQCLCGHLRSVHAR